MKDWPALEVDIRSAIQRPGSERQMLVGLAKGDVFAVCKNKVQNASILHTVGLQVGRRIEGFRRGKAASQPSRPSLRGNLLLLAGFRMN